MGQSENFIDGDIDALSKQKRAIPSLAEHNLRHNGEGQLKENASYKICSSFLLANPACGIGLRNQPRGKLRRCPGIWQQTPRIEVL